MENKIQIGINPLSWMSSDIPALCRHFSVDHCIAEAALIGYDGCELEDPFYEVIDQVPRMLEARGIRCIGAWLTVYLADQGIEHSIARLDDHMQKLRRVGATIVNLCDLSGAVHRKQGTPLSERPQLSNEGWESFCRDLDILAKHALEHGFQTAYHHHMGTIVQDAEDIRRLMSGTQSLGLLFDTGHLAYADADPCAILAEHQQRITHVHLKNVRPQVLKKHKDADNSFIDAILAGAFTVPGDDINGEPVIDFREIVRQLVANSFQGWLVVEAEQDPQLAEPYSYAALGYHYVKLVLTQELFRKRQLESGHADVGQPQVLAASEGTIAALLPQ